MNIYQIIVGLLFIAEAGLALAFIGKIIYDYQQGKSTVGAARFFGGAVFIIFICICFVIGIYFDSVL